MGCYCGSCGGFTFDYRFKESRVGVGFDSPYVWVVIVGRWVVLCCVDLSFTVRWVCRLLIRPCVANRRLGLALVR